MNLVVHTFKKDVRYLRLLLLLWFVLLLVNSLLLRSGLDRLIASDEGIQALSIAFSLLYALQQILQVVIVCQLVQADALVGTTAFWMTRPIARKALLLSKSLFVFLVLVLPSLLVEGVVLLLNGISLSRGLDALPEFVVVQIAFFLLPAMLLAALTQDLARLVVAGLVSVISFFLIHYTVLASNMSVGRSGRMPWVVTSGTLMSAFLVIGLGAMIIIYQYLKRRPVYSATSAMLGMLLVIATVNFWPWDLRTPSKALPAQSALNPDDVGLLVQKYASQRGIGTRWIMGSFKFQGIPLGFFFEGMEVDATLQLPDGKLIRSRLDQPLFGMSFLAFPQTVSDFLQASEQVTVLNKPDQGVTLTGPYAEAPVSALLSVDAETYQTYKDIPGTYAARVTLRADQYRVEATMPLKPGSRHEGELGEVTLMNLAPYGAPLSRAPVGFVLTLRESSVRQLRWTPGVSYVLRNRTRKEALLGRRVRSKDIFGRLPSAQQRFAKPDELLLPGLLAVNHSPISFTTWETPNYKGPVIDEEWLQQAELLRVESRFIGQFSKSVRMENFVMNQR